MPPPALTSDVVGNSSNTSITTGGCLAGGASWFPRDGPPEQPTMPTMPPEQMTIAPTTSGWSSGRPTGRTLRVPSHHLSLPEVEGDDLEVPVHLRQRHLVSALDAGHGVVSLLLRLHGHRRGPQLCPVADWHGAAQRLGGGVAALLATLLQHLAARLGRELVADLATVTVGEAAQEVLHGIAGTVAVRAATRQRHGEAGDRRDDAEQRSHALPPHGCANAIAEWRR